MEIHETRIGVSALDAISKMPAILHRIAETLARIELDSSRDEIVLRIPRERAKSILNSLEEASGLLEVERDASSDNGIEDAADSWDTDYRNLCYLESRIRERIKREEPDATS